MLRLLRQHGATIPTGFDGLTLLTDFGVAYRYEAYDEVEEPFDRQEILREVEHLLRHVQSLLPPEPPRSTTASLP